MISSELAEKVFQFVDGEITVYQLEDWLAPRLPTFVEPPDNPNADIVDAIELGLAEMSDGIRTEEQLRELLRDVLQEHEAVLVAFSDMYTVTTSTNRTPKLQPVWSAEISTIQSLIVSYS